MQCSAIKLRGNLYTYIYLTHWVAAFCFVRNPVPNFFGGNLKQMPEFRRLAIKIQKRTTMQKKWKTKMLTKIFKTNIKSGNKTGDDQNQKCSFLWNKLKRKLEFLVVAGPLPSSYQQSRQSHLMKKKPLTMHCFEM